MFFLPRGPVENAQLYFKNVYPRHKALIQHVATQYSLLDLTPPVLKDLEDLWKAKPVMAGRKLDTLTSAVLARNCAAIVAAIARTKLKWICGWRGLCRVLLVFPSLSFEVWIDGQHLDEDLEGILLNDVTFYRNYIFRPSGAAADMLQIFKGSLMDVERKGRLVVDRTGWLQFMQWVNGEVDFEEDWNDPEHSTHPHRRQLLAPVPA